MGLLVLRNAHTNISNHLTQTHHYKKYRRIKNTVWSPLEYLEELEDSLSQSKKMFSSPTLLCSWHVQRSLPKLYIVTNVFHLSGFLFLEGFLVIRSHLLWEDLYIFCEENKFCFKKEKEPINIKWSKVNQNVSSSPTSIQSLYFRALEDDPFSKLSSAHILKVLGFKSLIIDNCPPEKYILSLLLSQK